MSEMGERLRWRLFKAISAFGWWVCPEPHKTNLQAATPTWAQVSAMLSQAKGTKPK